MLAPLLLLLSQDPLLLTGLEDRMRYFPPVLAITAFLTTTAVVQVRLGGRVMALAAIMPGPLLLCWTLRLPIRVTG